MVRMDRGTENSQVAQYQIAFRMSHANDLAAEKSVKYGSSPSNSVYVHMFGRKGSGADPEGVERIASHPPFPPKFCTYVVQYSSSHCFIVCAIYM